MARLSEMIATATVLNCLLSTPTRRHNNIKATKTCLFAIAATSITFKLSFIPVRTTSIYKFVYRTYSIVRCGLQSFFYHQLCGLHSRVAYIFSSNIDFVWCHFINWRNFFDKTLLTVHLGNNIIIDDYDSGDDECMHAA